MRNLDRFKADLQSLLDQANKLELAFLIKVHGKPEVIKALELDGDDSLNNLPNFSVEYEAWYSECLVLIRQLLPDRLLDFKEHFEVPKSRKANDITYATYRIQDALKGLRVTRPPYNDVVVDAKAAVPHFQQQVSILKASGRRFESSLFEIRQLVQADLFDEEMGSARELAKNKFTRAAGAVAGVVLEKHLAQVCNDHQIKISKKYPGISDLNEALKASSVIDVPQWRLISMLADIRNLCDHNKQKEPTEQQVSDLLDGVDRILKTVF